MTSAADTASHFGFMDGRGATADFSKPKLSRRKGPLLTATRALVGGVLLALVVTAAEAGVGVLRSPKIAIDSTRARIAERLRGYPPPPNSGTPTEEQVLSGTQFCDGAVTLTGPELESVTRRDVNLGEIVVINGESYCLQSVAKAEGGSVYYFVRRGDKGAYYAGSQQDGGRSGALARFDVAVEAAAFGSTEAPVLASR